ncbi:uncharacterized protein LOC108034699 [Drosophila biarmipes]|uniref:uncharacterized protein LOC108034699 n=1 Tax=Drosophila biarmipes TaxID=125945 RepID=UPI0007E7C7AD|nr:uncharacterized protein LOC108034699 [Drosophila biarmipes]
MSSVNSSATPTTSAAVQKQSSKDQECTMVDPQEIEEIDKRLKSLVARLTTLENSLADLSSPLQTYFDGDHGDTDRELETLQDALDVQDQELSDLVADENIGDKKDVHDEELKEEASKKP